MAQSGGFVGTWTIKEWRHKDCPYPGLVEKGKGLTITEEAPGTFTLGWVDQGKRPCTVKGLKLSGSQLGVESAKVERPHGLERQLVCATVVARSVKVVLTFPETEGGPQGTIIAEVNPPPPIDLPVLATLWRRLRSLFLRLFSLFR